MWQEGGRKRAGRGEEEERKRRGRACEMSGRSDRTTTKRGQSREINKAEERSSGGEGG